MKKNSLYIKTAETTAVTTTATTTTTTTTEKEREKMSRFKNSFNLIQKFLGYFSFCFQFVANTKAVTIDNL